MALRSRLAAYHAAHASGRSRKWPQLLLVSRTGKQSLIPNTSPSLLSCLRPSAYPHQVEENQLFALPGLQMRSRVGAERSVRLLLWECYDRDCEPGRPEGLRQQRLEAGRRGQAALLGRAQTDALSRRGVGSRRGPSPACPGAAARLALSGGAGGGHRDARPGRGSLAQCPLTRQSAQRSRRQLRCCGDGGTAGTSSAPRPWRSGGVPG
jgi:hypothetical protein